MLTFKNQTKPELIKEIQELTGQGRLYPIIKTYVALINNKLDVEDPNSVFNTKGEIYYAYDTSVLLFPVKENDESRIVDIFELLDMSDDQVGEIFKNWNDNNTGKDASKSILFWLLFIHYIKDYNGEKEQFNKLYTMFNKDISFLSNSNYIMGAYASGAIRASEELIERVRENYLYFISQIKGKNNSQIKSKNRRANNSKIIDSSIKLMLKKYLERNSMENIDINKNYKFNTIYYNNKNLIEVIEAELVPTYFTLGEDSEIEDDDTKLQMLIENFEDSMKTTWVFFKALSTFYRSHSMEECEEIGKALAYALNINNRKMGLVEGFYRKYKVFDISDKVFESLEPYLNDKVLMYWLSYRLQN